MPQASTIVSPPFNRLNQEILQSIFKTCCASDLPKPFTCFPELPYIQLPQSHSACFVLDGHKNLIRDCPQLSISRVCSKWRNIALRTSQLWDNICILDSSEANLSIAREYLSRAGNTPICIGLREDEVEHYSRSPMGDLIAPYRLRAITVFYGSTPDLLVDHVDDVKEHQTLALLPSLSERNVTDLESYTVCQVGVDPAGSELDLNNDFRYSNLSVNNIMSTHWTPGIDSSMRVFVGSTLSTDIFDCWNFLSDHPLKTMLEETMLGIAEDYYYFEDSSNSIVPMIQLQHLRSLNLYSKCNNPGVGEIPFGVFIEKLVLPALERLTLTSRVAWPTTAFQSLAHRSDYFPHLKHFKLAHPASEVDAGALLALMPALESMSLCSSAVTTHTLFDHNTLKGLATGSLAPRLHSLTMGYISNVGHFLDMVESRMKNGKMSGNGVPVPFKHVEFYLPGRGDRDCCSRVLDDMRQRGIQIEAKVET